jgi:O-antigen/teichoic acid export membrane protein
MRTQTDQWIAAHLFALTSFAAFSIAALVGQVVHIFRHSVMEAFLPSMSRMQAAGDVNGMMEMNKRANVIVGALLFPMLALAFAFAEDLVTIVYTATYVEAAPVMRVYIVAMAAMVIEMGSIVLLLRDGSFALRITGAALVLSVAVSWSAAHAVGLPGAAAGSVLAIYLERAVMLRRISRQIAIPFSRVQDWRALGWALASAAAAAALAALAVHRFLEIDAPLARVAVGSAILAAAYAALNWRKLR